MSTQSQDETTEMQLEHAREEYEGALSRIQERYETRMGQIGATMTAADTRERASGVARLMASEARQEATVQFQQACRRIWNAAARGRRL